MTKARRYIEPGGVYFITSVTNKRAPLLVNEVAARFLVASLIFHKYIFNYKLLGYVVMPNHFHILVQPNDRYNISKIMNHIKGNYARKYNQIIRRVGKLWQQGFYDSVMRDENEIRKWLEYMHNNPVDAGIVSSPEEYEFSSYHQYYGNLRTSIQAVIDKIW